MGDLSLHCLPGAISSFVSDMTSRPEDYRRTTVKTYKANLAAYHRWVQAHNAADDTKSALSMPQLNRYVTYLRTKPNSSSQKAGLRPRTVRGQFSAIRALNEWLLRRKVLDQNPIDQIELPKRDRAVQRWIPKSTVLDLINACPRIPRGSGAHPLHRRVMVTAMIHVLCSGGPRRFELLDMRLSDIDREGSVIVVEDGKGGDRGEIFLPRETVAALKAWLDLRAKMNCLHDYLWVDNRTRRVRFGGLKRIFSDLATIAGHEGNRNITAHGFRRACASNMIQNGADIKLVQEQLRHKNPQTTMLYIAGDPERRLQMVEKSAFRPAGTENEWPTRRGNAALPLPFGEGPGEGDTGGAATSAGPPRRAAGNSAARSASLNPPLEGAGPSAPGIRPRQRVDLRRAAG